jgi:hypothetical protein
MFSREDALASFKPRELAPHGSILLIIHGNRKVR